MKRFAALTIFAIGMLFALCFTATGATPEQPFTNTELRQQPTENLFISQSNPFLFANYQISENTEIANHQPIQLSDFRNQGQPVYFVKYIFNSIENQVSAQDEGGFIGQNTVSKTPVKYMYGFSRIGLCGSRIRCA